MKIANAVQMAEIDRRTAEEWGVSSALLMENAGRAAAYAIAERWPAERRLLVLCGPGNNGGDGFSIARTLKNLGYTVVCLSSADSGKYSPDASAQRQAWLLAGGKILPLEQLPQQLSGGDAVIDALFGTGLQRPVSGLYAQTVELLKSRNASVAAVDMPSGVSSDTGQVLGIAPQCELTVTMGLPKPGLFIYPGKGLAGERIVAELGFPRQLLENQNLDGELLSASAVRELRRSPQPWAHKGTQGCALVIGGSAWYYGAPLLAAEAALRAGAGLCLWAAPEELVAQRPFAFREIMVWPLPTSQGLIGMEAWAELRGGLLQRQGGVSGRPLPRVTAVCVGPGLGRGPANTQLLGNIVDTVKVPLVIDADALYAIKGHILSERVVLTPHRGEMAALLDCTVAEVEGDLLAAAKEAAAKYRAVIVLKGTPTLICCRDKYWLLDSPNPVLAQGGTGDVLAGIITALLAQGYLPYEAAGMGVYLHSQAGKKAAEHQGPCGVLAGEIAAMLPRVFADLECQTENPPLRMTAVL